MIRAMFCLIFAASVMSAGVLLGARYGLMLHSAEYAGKSGGKRAWGGGLAAGYDFGQYRLVGAYDSFGVKKKADLMSLAAHVINRDDKYINPFLGIEGGKLALRLENQTEEKSVSMGALAIGVILLDERYKNMQMEFAYKYMRSFGTLDDGLKVGGTHHFSAAFLVNF